MAPRDENGRHVPVAVTAEPDWREAGRVARSEAWVLRERLRVLGERETEARVLVTDALSLQVAQEDSPDWRRRAEEWLRWVSE